jgi:hypothetical protein
MRRGWPAIGHPSFFVYSKGNHEQGLEVGVQNEISRFVAKNRNAQLPGGSEAPKTVLLEEVVN